MFAREGGPASRTCERRRQDEPTEGQGSEADQCHVAYGVGHRALRKGPVPAPRHGDKSSGTGKEYPAEDPKDVREAHLRCMKDERNARHRAQRELEVMRARRASKAQQEPRRMCRSYQRHRAERKEIGSDQEHDAQRYHALHWYA